MEQQSVQLDSETRRQIAALAKKWGLPATRHLSAVISRMAERIYYQEFGGLPMRDFAPIIRRIIENGLAQTDEELRNQFEFFADEAGWSDEEIEQALKSPWFPSVENSGTAT